MNKNRLEAFSDGVFAIVITLLILDIRLPEVSYEDLPKALEEVFPRIIAYVMSFAIIGLYWVSHHNAARLIDKINSPFLWMNALLLLLVSFLPFPTSLLGKYPYKALPIIMYGINLIACNIVGFAMLMYIKHTPGLLAPNYDKSYVKKQIPVYIYVNSAYIVAIAFAGFYPIISYIIYAGVVASIIFVYNWRISIA